jgi:hypothetical protein
MAEDVRYWEGSTAERVNGGLKDHHGGRTVQVRGTAKVMCHVMLGVFSLTALQLLRLVIYRRHLGLHLYLVLTANRARPLLARLNEW